MYHKMGEPPNPTNTTSYSHLNQPGYGFHPSDEQLICYYLTSKNNGDHRRRGIDVIKELDLYNFVPFDLPVTTCFHFGQGGRKKHWFCYVASSSGVLNERGGKRKVSSGGGFWKRKGRVRDMVGEGPQKVIVGTRKCFQFYMADQEAAPARALRTRWVMYEYALIDHHMASFVLCRVFAKSPRGKNTSEHLSYSCGEETCSILEHFLTSRAEESVANVRHIGVQHDGTITSAVGEVEAHDDNSIDPSNEVLRFPVGLLSEVDDLIANGTLAEQMRSTRQISSDAMIVAALEAILVEDFIELNDLL